MSETPSPVVSGLRCKCFNCGKGDVFAGYLRLNQKCPECGQDFAAADTADGPAFFVMFAALILFAPLFFLLPLTNWPVAGLVSGFAVLSAACLAFILWLLRPFKAVLMNLQLANRAEEARFEDR